MGVGRGGAQTGEGSKQQGTSGETSGDGIGGASSQRTKSKLPFLLVMHDNASEYTSPF